MSDAKITSPSQAVDSFNDSSTKETEPSFDGNLTKYAEQMRQRLSGDATDAEIEAAIQRYDEQISNLQDEIDRLEAELDTPGLPPQVRSALKSKLNDANQQMDELRGGQIEDYDPNNQTPIAKI